MLMQLLGILHESNLKIKKKTKQKREIIHNFFFDGLITKKVSTAIKSFT